MRKIKKLESDWSKQLGPVSAKILTDKINEMVTTINIILTSGLGVNYSGPVNYYLEKAFEDEKL